MSGYRRLYFAIGAFAMFMVAVVVQANQYWLTVLARDRPGGLVAQGNSEIDPALGRTIVALKHIDVFSIPRNEGRCALEVGDFEGLHLLVMTASLHGEGTTIGP